MIGTTLTHYRVLEQAGAGGMGVVYRAHDERLERDVALKVLPQGTLADDAARRRFRREALAVSRLAHPGIATIFDFDTQDGTDFLVMEYVPGESLDALIARGPLPEDDAVALALQIAEALEASHEMGVVHCDLKPGNIRITPRRRVKVLDFGLARLLQRDGGWVSTSTAADPGALAGTLPYMSPEQLLGQRPDGRTDLYALGVVLYEMVTGRRPFADAQPAALMYSIVNTPPPAPAVARPGLSAWLGQVIVRALEKSPERRFQTARELVASLARAASAEAAWPPRPIESLAVLPLRDLSGDPAQEYFAEGMTEALITALAQVSALRVISRTSVMQYKDARRPLPEIARALGVDAIVEGSVLRAGDRVRITAQLIEAASDRHLWARSYERDAGDVLALQAEVVQAIADEVRVRLTPQERARLAAGRSVDPLAYESYLRGRYFWNKRDPADVRRAIEHFNAAIAADPTYALAYTGLADSYYILGDQHAVPPLEAAPRALAATRRALELDPQLAEAHTSLGFGRMFFEWDWDGTEQAYRRALALNPNYATAHQWYAEHLAAQGRFDEAIAEARRAHHLDPLAFIMGTTLGDVLFFSRRYDEAIAELEAIVQMEPNFLHAVQDLGRALTEVGRFDAAFAAFEDARRRGGEDARAPAGLARAYAMAGRHAEAREILGDLEQRARARFVSAFSISTIHATLGAHDAAFEWLRRGLDERDTGMLWIKVHPRMDVLRGDPRFQDILRRMRLA